MISLSGTPSVTGSINVGSGPDAVVATAGNLFVANGSDGTVSVVNLATGSPVSGSPVTVGSNPDAVGVAGDVFVANKGSNSISILNPTNGSVLQTVGSVQSPVSLSVGIAPGSSATSALSIAESLGLSNPAEACSGCLQSEDVSQLEDEAYVGDEADISGETDEALALDAMGGFPINTANGNFTYALAGHHRSRTRGATHGATHLQLVHFQVEFVGVGPRIPRRWLQLDRRPGSHAGQQRAHDRKCHDHPGERLPGGFHPTHVDITHVCVSR